MAAANEPSTPQPLSSASTLSERTPDAEAGSTHSPYNVHTHENADAVLVHDEDINDERSGHATMSWSHTDGPRRTMRKVSRRVLPLAAAAYALSNVRDNDTSEQPVVRSVHNTICATLTSSETLLFSDINVTEHAG